MAKVLSSISGNLISAASAGFAPTNSADVSAIASAYQVVSATATQLYAGTAYVTSINSAPLSASRAGNAANASLANSAWYDGTGRLISSLPDSATVSAIAESYAESAASGKLDTTAQVVTATAGDGTYITSINGMGISGQGGGGGSTGDYVEKSAMNVAIGSGNTASADISFAQGSGNSAKYRSFAQGLQNTATAWSVAIGGSNTARSTGAAFGVSNTAFNTSIAVGRQNYASSESLCVGVENAATKCSVALGQYNTAKNTAFSYGRFVSSQNNAFAIGNYNLKGNGDTTTGDSAAFVIGDGTGTAARHDLMLVTKDGEITMYSSTADTTGTGILSAIRAISAAATGGVDSATVSAIASSYANSAASSKLDASAVAFGVNDGDLVVKSISGRPISAKYALYDVNGIYLSSYALSADVSSTIDTVSNNSASWGAGGIDSATCSAIASSYAESAASSKMDTSAMSAYATTAYVTAGLSGKENVFNAGTGLEFVQSGSDRVLQVEAPVDIVAGPGIVIDNPDGNTLRVSTDSAYETVLWSGSPTNSVTLSETMNNFEFIDVYERWDNANANAIVHRIYMEGKTTAVLNFSIGGNAWYLVVQKLDLNGTSLSVNSAHSIHGASYTSTDILHESNTTLLKNTIVKVVGIHRIAGGN